MLTSKQRATLRRAAPRLHAVFQMGKDGITENFTASCDAALSARELIKITVLKSAPLEAKEAGYSVAERLGAECVAAIGNKFILYRYNPNKTEHVKL